MALNAIRLGRRIGLRARIMSLAAVPIIGLVAVMVLGQYAARQEHAAEAEYEIKRLAVGALVGFSTDFAQMRISADAFRHRPDAQRKAAFDASAGAAAAMLEELEKQGSGALGAELRPFLRAYIDDFNSLAKQFDENGSTHSEGMLGALAFAAMKVKGELALHDQQFGTWSSTIRNTFADLMLAERDFRANPINAHAAAFDRLYENLRKIIQVGQLPDDVRKPFAAALGDYNDKFNAWVDGLQHAGTITNRLAADYTVVQRRVRP
jgi:hypothetical protein